MARDLVFVWFQSIELVAMQIATKNYRLLAVSPTAIPVLAQYFCYSSSSSDIGLFEFSHVYIIQNQLLNPFSNL